MFRKIKFEREVSFEELQEVMVLAEFQETTEKETNTSIRIDGEYAKIEVDIDDDGNITVL